MVLKNFHEIVKMWKCSLLSIEKIQHHFWVGLVTSPAYNKNGAFRVKHTLFEITTLDTPHFWHISRYAEFSWVSMSVVLGLLNTKINLFQNHFRANFKKTISFVSKFLGRVGTWLLIVWVEPTSHPRVQLWKDDDK